MRSNPHWPISIKPPLVTGFVGRANYRVGFVGRANYRVEVGRVGCYLWILVRKWNRIEGLLRIVSSHLKGLCNIFVELLYKVLQLIYGTANLGTDLIHC